MATTTSTPPTERAWGTERGRAIHLAAVEAKERGLSNYWYHLFIEVRAATTLKELKEAWEWCYRVSDHQHDNYKLLEALKDSRKAAFEGTDQNVNQRSAGPATRGR